MCVFIWIRMTDLILLFGPEYNLIFVLRDLERKFIFKDDIVIGLEIIQK